MRDPWTDPMPSPCKFEYQEHDGSRYCFEHGGFLEAGPFYSGARSCDNRDGGRSDA